MMKNLIAALFLGALCACGGGGDDGGAAADPATGDKTLTVGNETVRFDQTGKYNLTVLSSNNTVTIGAGNTLAAVRMEGANNRLNLEDSVTIDSLLVTGANNSVSIGNSTTIAEFDIRGDNATVSIGAHNRIEQLAASGSNGLVTIQSATSAVPSIRLSGSNTRIRVPAGYLAHTTITNTGVNNTVEER